MSMLNLFIGNLVVFPPFVTSNIMKLHLFEAGSIFALGIFLF
jgi:hypothetical protein